MSRESTKTIFVVEDDLDIRESLIEILSEEGYVAMGFSDGLIALEHLKTAMKLPDIILLDAMMPRMDGGEFRKKQLEVPRLAAIPTVLITANGQAHDKLGHMFFKACLRKPLSLEELFSVLETILFGQIQKDAQ